MKILVTGGSGTLGGYVLRELLNFGHEVTCYSRTPLVDLQSLFLAGDIQDSEAVQKACIGQGVVVHLAAVPGPRRASPQQMMAVNLIGTLNVLEAALPRESARLSSLLRRRFWDSLFRRQPYASLISCQRAARLLKFRPA